MLSEVYLSHGTKPDIVMSLLAGGLNERFSGGLFGHGTYFAEDVAKNDQYVSVDSRFSQPSELHKLLYSETRHPGDVYYIFLCRVSMGFFVRTKDARTSVGDGRSIWSSSERELAAIPGSNPPEYFHSLLAETGERIARFREIMVFHSDRIYPEYLVAYHRV